MKSSQERFAQIRHEHKLELTEDYVERIHQLIKLNGEARVVDLADYFGVSSATVNNTISRLQSCGLVRSQPYRAIFLTAKGRAMASNSLRRHLVVQDFLIALGVDESTAKTEAEAIEHHVSKKTLVLMKKARGFLLEQNFA